MHEIYGGYVQAELSDGRFGNYQVARRIFQDFQRLANEHPAAFQTLAHQLHQNGDVEKLSDACKQACRDVGLAFREPAENGGLKWQRPLEDLREFAKLSVMAAPQGLLQRFFSVNTGVPIYKMGTPFKKPSARALDEVESRYLTTVCLDWIGPDSCHYPGNRLIP